MGSESIFTHDSARGQEQTLDTRYFTRPSFIAVFTGYVSLPTFNSVCIYFPIHVSALNFLLLSPHTVGPPLNSQGRQLALHQTHARTKGKLQIVAVWAATRGRAQWDSGCLRLALITDRQTHQALETPAGTKKTQNWFRRKNTG